MNQKIMPIFDQTQPNDNLLHQLIHKIQPISKSRDLMGHTQFFTTPTQKTFNQLLISMNLYQNAKNLAFSNLL